MYLRENRDREGLIDISAKKSILITIKECLADSSGVIMTAPGLEDLVSVCGSIVDKFTREEFGERDLYLAIHGVERRTARATKE